MKLALMLTTAAFAVSGAAYAQDEETGEGESSFVDSLPFLEEGAEDELPFEVEETDEPLFDDADPSVGDDIPPAPPGARNDALPEIEPLAAPAATPPGPRTPLARDADVITVSATKRDQTLQEVPVAVTVVGSDLIEKAQISDILDLQSVVPSLRVEQRSSVADTTFIIRGFGNGGGFNPGVEPAVGVFIDGVYRSRSAGAIADLPAVQRIEVLKGPQSTLFGKNASAGVISVITNEPSFDWDGNIEIVAANFNQRAFRGYLTGPITDTLAFSLGGGINRRDGYVENTVIPPGGQIDDPDTLGIARGLPAVPRLRPDGSIAFDADTSLLGPDPDPIRLGDNADLNNRNRFLLNGQLLWEPTDRFTIRAFGDWAGIKEDCCYLPYVFAGDLTADFAQSIADDLNGATTLADGSVIEDANDPTPFRAPGTPGYVTVDQLIALDPFDYRVTTDRQNTNVIDNFGGSWQMAYNTDWADFTSITAYRETLVFQDIDIDFNGVPAAGGNPIDTDIKTFTQELRASGETERFDWLVGGFFFHETIDIESQILADEFFRVYLNSAVETISAETLPSPSSILAVETLFNNAGVRVDDVPVVAGSFFLPENGPNFREEFSQTGDSLSLFGQIDFRVTDKLTATFGLSYNYDQKEAEALVATSEPFFEVDLDNAVQRVFARTRGVNILPNELSADQLEAAEQAIQSGTPLVDIFDAENLAFIQDTYDIDCFVPGSRGTIREDFQATDNPETIDAEAVCNPLRTILNLDQAQYLPPFVPFPNSVEDGTTEDNKLTYTARLAYDVLPYMNVYASYATGFKASSFGLDRFSSPPQSAYPALIEAVQNGDPALTGGTDAEGRDLTVENLRLRQNLGRGSRFAGPEDTTVYELGLKFNLGNGGYLNVALFDQTIENFQQVTFTGTGFLLQNAEEQNVRGLEIDAAFSPLPETGLGFIFSGTFLDPEYVSFRNAGVIVGSPEDALVGEPDDGIGDLSGKRPAGVADRNIFLGGQYEHEFQNGNTSFVRIGWQHESRVSTADNVPAVYAPREVNSVDGSIGFGLDNGFNMQVFGRNLFNNEYLQASAPTILQPRSFSGFPNQPRTYGVTLRKEF